MASIHHNEVVTWLATISQTSRPPFLLRYIFVLLFSIGVDQAFCTMLVIGGMILFCSIRFLTALKRTKNLPFLMRKYRELQIWNDYISQFVTSMALPPFIFFGGLIAVLGNYGTIRGREILHPVHYIILPENSALGLSFVHGLLPFATGTNDLSVSLIREMRKVKGGLAQKRVKSFRPLGFSCGAAGMLTRESKSSIFNFIVDNTVTMLLTF